MADTSVIDLDTGDVVEKRGRGRPRGNKNKPKETSMVVLSSFAPVKWCPGRPFGSKNKPKPSTSLVTNIWMQTLHATILLLLLLATHSLFSLSLVLDAVSSNVCL
jgi:hypothetical protein